ncbi:hypothetical protein B0H11DRAFT_1932199 [Mycena galericulata]|nr:hypothetical protein B0H11DRAFT_1932199 [Mycena galericulata]
MTIRALGFATSPPEFLALFTLESRALGCVRFEDDFQAPESSDCEHNAFTITRYIPRCDIFESHERVVTPFTTILFGEIKYGPTRTGDHWLVYLKAPDWSHRGWNPIDLEEAYDEQVAALEHARWAIKPSTDPGESWLDDMDCIVVTLLRTTEWTRPDRKNLFVGEAWSDSNKDLHRGDTVVFQCTLHTQVVSAGPKTVRNLSIKALEMQQVAVATHE